MPSIHDTQLSPYSPAQLFDLVADIERYPEFLPWCRAARILRREPGRLEAELVVCFKNICESYISEVLLQPASEGNPARIEAKMISGPFEYLYNHWQFSPDASGTSIDFKVDFKFRSRLLDMLMGGVFAKAQEKIVEAFRLRADAMFK